MTLDPRPAAVPFDLGSGELPPTLEPAFLEPRGPILLLVAAEPDDLAATAAIALSEARAARGLTTVLADAGLDAPRLHELLETENLEGLVDVFLFGASLERITVRPEGRSFGFAPAGAYAPDPAEVLQSPRWDRIAEEVTGDDALLVVFLPAAAPGARELSRRIGHAILVGDQGGAVRAASRLDPTCEVVATITPRAAGGPPPAAAPFATPDAVDVPEPGRPTKPGSSLDEPLVIRHRKKRRSVSPLLLLALVLALGAAAWFGYRQLAGREAPTAPAVAPASVPTESVERGAPLETPIPFSVAVEAHPDLESAMQRVQLLARAEPGIDFFLAPVSVRGVLYFRLLAGPVADRESGMTVMRRLVDAGHKTAMDDWAIRPTSFAFLLGDYDTREDAVSRQRELAAEGIPTYLVTQRYEVGAPRFRVYGGAYENRAEAEVMQEMLGNAGEEARLIERVGEPAA